MAPRPSSTINITRADWHPSPAGPPLVCARAGRRTPHLVSWCVIWTRERQNGHITIAGQCSVTIRPSVKGMLTNPPPSPGATPPKHLDGSMLGDYGVAGDREPPLQPHRSLLCHCRPVPPPPPPYFRPRPCRGRAEPLRPLPPPPRLPPGFDPLRLGVKQDLLKYFREGELTNGRCDRPYSRRAQLAAGAAGPRCPAPAAAPGADQVRPAGPPAPTLPQLGHGCGGGHPVHRRRGPARLVGGRRQGGQPVRPQGAPGQGAGWSGWSGGAQLARAPCYRSSDTRQHEGSAAVARCPPAPRTRACIASGAAAAAPGLSAHPLACPAPPPRPIDRL